MGTTIHRANTRGHANHGWLETYHTFSFADYFNQERIHFGALRVLNDDWVGPGEGFGRHPHDNMEIVTIMLEGELKHSDSMGHTEVLRENEVQAMSAGTGLFHSEMNNSPDKPLRLLQIWVFPEERNIKPRYEQKAFVPELRRNNFQLLAAPGAADGAMDIKQQSWFWRVDLDKGREIEFHLHEKDNGLYIFNINGLIQFNGEETLQKRDGAGIWEINSIKIEAKENSELLLIEVPMLE